MFQGLVISGNIASSYSFVGYRERRAARRHYF